MWQIFSKIGIFSFYVLISSYGLYKIKKSVFGINLSFIIGFSSYVAGFLIWMYILKSNKLSIAFPIAAGSLIIVTQFFGYFLLDEPMSRQKFIGVSLIFVGLIVMYSTFGDKIGR